MAWKKEKRRGPVWNERQAWIFCGCSSCFLVPILHILGNGGVLDNTPWMSSQYLAGWLLETVALCAVDCFALISGYVGSTAKFRWSRVGNLWLGIVFYTLLITALFAVWMPEVVSKRTWFGAIFPITSNQYWFMTAYVGMFFFIPLMNLVLEKASKRMLTEFLVAVLVVFSFLPCLFTILLQDSPYGLHRGYSMVWLIMLYLMGGYLRKYEIPQKLSRKKAVVVFCISTLLAWLSKVVIEWGTNRMLGYPAGGHQFCVLRLPLHCDQRRGSAVLFCTDGVSQQGAAKGDRRALSGGPGGVYHPCASPGVELCAAGLPDLCCGLSCVADAPVGGGAGLWHLSDLLAD